MIRNLTKLIRRAFPGFPDRYVTRVGEIVAVHDWPGASSGGAEQATDRFRPRYAVDVQPLTPQGEPDAGRPVLEGLPLPAFIAGDGRGVLGYPDVGTRVRLGFDYGLPSHPYILDVLPEGRALPAVRPGETVVQQQDGAHLRFDAKGNAELRSDGELREDSHTRLIIGDEALEEYGKLTRTVDGDQAVTVGGSLREKILGALRQEIAGDARALIVGGEERTTLGDRSELVAGKWEMAVQESATFKSNLEDVLVEAVTGSAAFKAAVKLTLDSVALELIAGSGGLKLGSAAASEPVILGQAFQTFFDAHIHTDGSGQQTSPPTTLMQAVPGLLSGKVTAV